MAQDMTRGLRPRLRIRWLRLSNHQPGRSAMPTDAVEPDAVGQDRVTDFDRGAVAEDRRTRAGRAAATLLPEKVLLEIVPPLLVKISPPPPAVPTLPEKGAVGNRPHANL